MVNRKATVVSVQVLSGRNLAAADLCGTSDPYCIVRYGGKKLRTCVIKRTLNPIWNETAAFELRPITCKKNSSIIVECWDKDNLKFDDPLGRVELSIGSILADQERFSKPSWYPLQKWRSSMKVSGDLQLSIKCDAAEKMDSCSENLVGEENKTIPVKGVKEQPHSTILFVADIDVDILTPALLKDLRKQARAEASFKATIQDLSIDVEEDGISVTSEFLDSVRSSSSSESISYTVAPVTDKERNDNALLLEDHLLKSKNGELWASPPGGISLPHLVFQKYDTDKDGTISREEFFNMALDLGYHFGGEDDGNRIQDEAFSILDQDGSSKIELEEFVRFWSRENRFKFLQLDEEGRHKVRSVDEYFSYFDKSGEKRLDGSQFRVMYDNMLLSGYTLAPFEQCWKDLDLNSDGFVHFNELLAFTIRMGLLHHPPGT